MFEQWLAARDPEEVRSAWTALAPRRHQFSPRDRTLTLHGAALLAEAMLGERADWILNVIGRPVVFQRRGEVDACFLDDAWDVNQRCHETWDVYEQRDGARGVQLVMVGLGSVGGQPDGGGETVVRIFDRERAASIRIGSNRVATIGEIDLAPLDLLSFSHECTTATRTVAPLVAELYAHGLPWGHRLEASGRTVYGQLPNRTIDRVIARLAVPPEITSVAAVPHVIDKSVSWEWDVEGTFNPRYDARVSAEGLIYSCEIQGPFCGYDRVGSQSWADFIAVGPPSNIQMPASIAAEIRDHARGILDRDKD